SPRCGVNLGSCGIALAWYRLSLLRDDPDALATAIAWGKRTMTWTTGPDAFHTSDKMLTKKTIGTIALNHTESGVHCVRALIALAGGDFSESERWVAAFDRAARARSSFLDLTLGRAGLLHGCVMLDEASPRPYPLIRDLGDHLAAGIMRR